MNLNMTEILDFVMPVIKGALILLALALIALVSAHFLGHDNAVEEAAEDVVEQRTGQHVDFTPEDAEQPKK